MAYNRNVCPKPNKCVYDDVNKSGLHFCMLPRCIYTMYPEETKVKKENPEKTPD